MAAAALGDGEKVAFVPLLASGRFPALKANQIDLLARNTSRTLGREANIGTHFAGILYYELVPLLPVVLSLDTRREAGGGASGFLASAADRTVVPRDAVVIFGV